MPGVGGRRRTARIERLEAAKRDEIERAWTIHLANAVAEAAAARRGWLLRHLQAQRMMCAYCGAALVFDGPSQQDTRATLDHIVPTSLGGADSFENTLAACQYCNGSKGQMSRRAYLASPRRQARRKSLHPLPDRLSNETESPFYDPVALDWGIGIRFNGRERTDVSEYCVSEGWIRIPTVGRDRRGAPLLIRLAGDVKPFYLD